jgi:hypothetical protein
MDDSKINENLGKIYNKLEDLHVTTVIQQGILDEHVRRSAMLEAKMIPVEKHVAMVNGAFKFVGLLCSIAGIVEGLVIALEYFRKMGF